MKYQKKNRNLNFKSKNLDILLFKGHSGSVLSVCFSPNGNKLASGSWDQSIKLW